MENLQQLKIPLKKIMLATNNFDQESCISKNELESIYKGTLILSNCIISVAVKRFDEKWEKQPHQFLTEIQRLISLKHPNLVSILGFCEEGKEKIIVYENESRGSLDRYIQNPDLTWIQRLKISIDVARAINYIHNEVAEQHRVLHRDIKSANIQLNMGLLAKVADFGLSIIGPANVQHTFFVTADAGTFGYVDPLYFNTGVLTKESDVYSFGVVLFELFCGRLAFEEGKVFLGPLAERKYNEDKMSEMIIPELRKQMNMNSINTFTAIAYQCLSSDRSKRPKMAWIIKKLESALEYQTSLRTAEIARVGLWGTKSSESHQNRWSFIPERNHKVKMITVDHGDLIYSLMFTTEFRGIMQTSNKAGGWNGGDIVSEVALADDEEIIAISGTVGKSRGTNAGITIISSLAFVTNKQTHGPYGSERGTPFNVPWDKGSFAGFYGLAGHYIDGIGVYLREAN